MLYFAYGSFMNAENLITFCPSAVPVGPADLLNYEVCFNFYSQTYKAGVTGAEFSPGKITHGVLYEIPESEILHLDIIEEVPEGNYFRETVIVVDSAGVYQTADIYRSSHPQGPFQSSRKYIRHMLKGAQENKLPGDYINKLQDLHNSLDE